MYSNLRLVYRISIRINFFGREVVTRNECSNSWSISTQFTIQFTIPFPKHYLHGPFTHLLEFVSKRKKNFLMFTVPTITNKRKKVTLKTRLVYYTNVFVSCLWSITDLCQYRIKLISLNVGVTCSNNFFTRRTLPVIQLCLIVTCKFDLME